MNRPTAMDVARKYVALLKEKYLTPEQFQQVVDAAVNGKGEPWPEDLCDSNMAMEEALIALTGDPTPHTPEDDDAAYDAKMLAITRNTNLANQAWGLAHSGYWYFEQTKNEDGTIRLSPGKVEEYTKNSHICPNCGMSGFDTEGIQYSNPEPGDEHLPDKAHHDITCDHCSASWRELLTVTGITDLRIPE